MGAVGAQPTRSFARGASAPRHRPPAATLRPASFARAAQRARPSPAPGRSSPGSPGRGAVGAQRPGSFAGAMVSPRAPRSASGPAATAPSERSERRRQRAQLERRRGLGAEASRGYPTADSVLTVAGKQENSAVLLRHCGQPGHQHVHREVEPIVTVAGRHLRGVFRQQTGRAHRRGSWFQSSTISASTASWSGPRRGAWSSRAGPEGLFVGEGADVSAARSQTGRSLRRDPPGDADRHDPLRSPDSRPPSIGIIPWRRGPSRGGRGRAGAVAHDVLELIGPALGVGLGDVASIPAIRSITNWSSSSRLATCGRATPGRCPAPWRASASTPRRIPAAP